MSTARYSCNWPALGRQAPLFLSGTRPSREDRDPATYRRCRRVTWAREGPTWVFTRVLSGVSTGALRRPSRPSWSTSATTLAIRICGAVMNSKLVEQCQARLQGLEIPHPFTIEAFCRSVARHRGRPLHLHPLPGPTRFCGLWVATLAADHVWYEPASSPFHRRHLILHELSHLMLRSSKAVYMLRLGP